jgi:PI-3-kinase-related kinase SMG-1
MIAEVQQLVSELQRVTLLWDELWLGALSQVSQDVGRRLTQLDNEVKKVRANASLSHDERIQVIEEKMRIILKPVGVDNLHVTVYTPCTIEIVM